MNVNNNINNNNKPAVASSTVTRDLRELDVKTDNIYESLVIMSKKSETSDPPQQCKGRIAPEAFGICIIK